MACGAWDRDITARLFWMGQFGATPTPEQVERMHPLRRAPQKPATAEELAEAAAVSWDSFERGLSSLNQQKG